MIIEIASEKKTAHFSVNPGNFPYKLAFLDRTTGAIVNVLIDSDTLHNLVDEMKDRDCWNRNKQSP